MSVPALTYAGLREAFERQALFADKTWRASPQPWPLDAAALAELEAIGRACAEFYQAVEWLRRRALAGESLLRNRELKAPWVAEYLDRGKPQALLAHATAHAARGAAPVLIRPDLLVTDDGFALTEIDAVPGGVGLTAFLNRLYASAGAVPIGGEQALVSGFYEALAALAPQVLRPLVAIVVSDEAATYRPEFEWLATQARIAGYPVYCLAPDEVMPLGEGLCAPIEGNPVRIDVLYRFFELFDLPNLPTAEAMLAAEAAGEVVITPPVKPWQEEKLALGLFHHHLLRDFWREHLTREAYATLRRIVPMTWIVDPAPIPPNATLFAPTVGGAPISSWEDLGEASQKERQLILKVSGFHETAWGARSVVLGSDVSRVVWLGALRHALREGGQHLHVLQEYRKPRRLRHPVFRDDGSLHEADGRVRLCPYFLQRAGTVSLCGVLCTFCPADKKIIHGMKDAVLLPCVGVAEKT